MGYDQQSQMASSWNINTNNTQPSLSEGQPKGHSPALPITIRKKLKESQSLTKLKVK